MLGIALNVDVWERVGSKNNRMSHHTDVTISEHDTSTILRTTQIMYKPLLKHIYWLI